MRSQTVSTILQHTAEQAKQHPERVFTTLAHHMDVEFLREAYRCTRKDSAPGVDKRSLPGQQSDAPAFQALVTEEPDALIGHVRICGGLVG
jgi:hypothetical protein